ncbi:MAG: UDP-2,3-diacylglucosamine diphosphatase, partial [Bacteroidales bacterium]
SEQVVAMAGKRFFLAHGDGLGNHNFSYKLMNWIFTNRFLQKLYGSLHPWWGIGFGLAWSKSSRLGKGVAVPFRAEREHLLAFIQKEYKAQAIDYFVFGHRHTPILMPVGNGAQMAILSDWIEGCTYGVFNGIDFQLKTFE